MDYLETNLQLILGGENINGAVLRSVVIYNKTQQKKFLRAAIKYLASMRKRAVAEKKDYVAVI